MLKNKTNQMMAKK